MESTERWQKTLPELLQKTIKESVRRIENNENGDLDIESKSPTREGTPRLFEDLLEIETISSAESETGQGYIKAQITAGRKLWLQSQKLALTKTISALKNHKWCIVRPARGHQWFTSDHPVIKLNYYGEGNYDLKGGWGKKGGNIFLPISPKHLLFTEIGDDMPDRLTFSPAQTKQLQSLIAERAMRWIFADRPLKLVAKLRPRHVDPEAFKQERRELENWHEIHKKSES